MRILSMLAVVMSWLVWGCSGAAATGPADAGPTCNPSGPHYEGYNSTAGTAVTPWLEAFDEMEAIKNSAGFDRSSFASLKTIYERAGGLSSSVQALAGLPSWEAQDTGARIHDGIEAAFARAADPQDVTPPRELWQLVGKPVLRFFHLALVARVTASSGTGNQWDQAFTLYGRSPDGATLAHLSAEVAEYDEATGARQNAAVFAAFIAGRCAATQGNAGSQTSAGADVEAALRQGWAYATAHYFQALSNGSADRVQLVEGTMWFRVVEPWMRAHGHDAEATSINAWVTPLLPGGARGTEAPDTAGAAASLRDLRMAFGLTL